MIKKWTIKNCTNYLSTFLVNEPYYFLIFLCLFLYFQTLFFGIVYLDDNVFVTEFSSISRHFSNWYMAFVSDPYLKNHGWYFRPILTLSFYLNSLIAGKDPFIFHLTNILLHSIAVCSLFWFLLKLKITKIHALLFSIIFAIHPALSEAVSWIPGRNDILLFIFVVLSLGFFIEKKTFFAFCFLYISYFYKRDSPYVNTAYFFISIFGK